MNTYKAIRRAICTQQKFGKRLLLLLLWVRYFPVPPWIVKAEPPCLDGMSFSIVWNDKDRGWLTIQALLLLAGKSKALLQGDVLGSAVSNKHLRQMQRTACFLNACMYLLYINYHLASIRKVLRHPLGLTLFMGPDVREMMRAKVRKFCY